MTTTSALDNEYNDSYEDLKWLIIKVVAKKEALIS